MNDECITSARAERAWWQGHMYLPVRWLPVGGGAEQSKEGAERGYFRAV